MGDMEFWRTTGIVTATAGQVAFALLYATFPWWDSPLGKALFFKASSFAIVLSVMVVGRTVDWPGEDTTFTVLYYVLALGIWVQAIAFFRVKRAGRQAALTREGDPE